MKKILSIGLIVIVAAIAIIIFQLGPIVKTGIETNGPDALHVSVDIGDVNISPLSGQLSVADFQIGQPKGFGEGAMVAVGELNAKLKTSSLFSNHIIIDTIEIIAPLLDVRRQDGKTNFQAFQDGMEIPTADETEADTRVPAEELTLTIRRLTIKAPRLLAKTDGFLKLDEDILLADFTLTNLGTDEKGLAPREIARHVMDALQPQITKALITAGASKGIQKLAKEAKGKLEKGIGGLLKKFGVKKKKDN